MSRVGSNDKKTKVSTSRTRNFEPKIFCRRSRISLAQIAENQEGQEEQQDSVDIYQAEGQQTVGYRFAPMPDQSNFHQRDGNHQENNNANDNLLPPAAL